MDASTRAKPATRSGVPSPSMSAMDGTPRTRPGGSSLSLGREPAIAWPARVRPEQRPILARERQERGVPLMAQTRSPCRRHRGRARAGPACRAVSRRRSGTAGAARRPGRGPAPRAAPAARHPRSACPVDPSRRIRVSPVHSMKSALPGVSTTASVTMAKRDGLVSQQAVLVEREAMGPRLAAVDRDPVGLTHAGPRP